MAAARRGPSARSRGRSRSGCSRWRCSSSSSVEPRTRCCRWRCFDRGRLRFANLLTLLLYAALSVVLFLVPLDLIQVQHYSATAAGAALLPFPLIMFALSRWSGGLVARVGSRAAVDDWARDRRARPRAVCAARNRRIVLDDVLSGGVVLAFGMAVTVAPLTTTVMSAVDRATCRRGVRRQQRRGASGGSPGDRGLRRRARPDVRGARQAAPRTDGALGVRKSGRSIASCPKMAGADVAQVTALPPTQHSAVRASIDDAFVLSFRLVMMGAAALGLAAACVGNGIRRSRTDG